MPGASKSADPAKQGFSACKVTEHSSQSELSARVKNVVDVAGYVSLPFLTDPYRPSLPVSVLEPGACKYIDVDA